MNDLTHESEVATRLGVGLKTLRRWRKEGVLTEGVHWTLEGQAVMLTAEGVRRAQVRAGLEAEAPPEGGLGIEDAAATSAPLGPTIRVKVSRHQGHNPRLLRCLLIDPQPDIGPRVPVRLIQPRVFQHHFHAGQLLDVVPAAEEVGTFEYHGPAPRRVRI